MRINQIDQLPYTLRIKVSIAFILMVMIFIVKFAPNFHHQKLPTTFQDENIQVTLDLIEITIQEGSVPPPPRPRVQVSTTFPVIIDEQSIDQLLDFESTFQLIPLPSEGRSNGGIVRNPQHPPRVQRIVEPVSPNNHALQQIRAEITAQLTVNASGRVEEVEILEIRIYNRRTRSYEYISDIDQYFIDSTISAAMQWQFRAATQDGQSVRSVSNHVFTFGSGIN